MRIALTGQGPVLLARTLTWPVKSASGNQQEVLLYLSRMMCALFCRNSKAPMILHQASSLKSCSLDAAMSAVLSVKQEEKSLTLTLFFKKGSSKASSLLPSWSHSKHL